MNIYDTKVWKKFTSKYPTPLQKEHICSIVKQFNVRSHQIRVVADLCDADYVGDWVAAYARVVEYIKEHGGVHTLELYQLRYGDLEGLKRYNENKQRKSNTLISFIRRHGLEEGTKRYDSFCISNRGNKTVERFIKKYGRIQGTLKHKNLREKERLKGTKTYFVERYGSNDGAKIYDDKISKLRFGASRQGFIAKYGEDEGNIRIREAKNNVSLTSYQKRYGELEGLRRYNEHVAKCKFNNTSEGFIARHGETLGRERYNAWLTTSTIGVASFSRISQELFSEIDNSDPNTYYATKNKEFVLNTDTGVYFFDYTNTRLKKIIEFNGDIFHGNPSIFCRSDRPHPFNKNLTCEDMWRYDEVKINQVVKRGYEVLVIWEKDYRLNKDNEISRCRQFLGI